MNAVIGTMMGALIAAAVSCSTEATLPDQGSAGAGGSASGAAGEAAEPGSTGDELGEAGAANQRLVEACMRFCSLTHYLDNLVKADGCEPGQRYRGGVLVDETSAGGAGASQDVFPIDPDCASECNGEVPPACVRDVVDMNECFVESDWECVAGERPSVTVTGCDDALNRAYECVNR